MAAAESCLGPLLLGLALASRASYRNADSGFPSTTCQSLTIHTMAGPSTYRHKFLEVSLTLFKEEPRKHVYAVWNLITKVTNRRVYKDDTIRVLKQRRRRGEIQ